MPSLVIGINGKDIVSKDIPIDTKLLEALSRI
jgi:hypothetical protein